MLLNIVKKGYARGVGSRQSSTLVPAHRIGLAAHVVVDAGLVPRDRWLANRKPSDRVYLDATGLSIGGVHHAEKEPEKSSRLQKREGSVQLSQVSIANESDQVS